MRNPNGFGTVAKLSGKRRRPWIAKVTTGYETDFLTEKTKQLRQVVGYYATKKEAMEALAKFNDNPFSAEASRVTFRQCYEGAKLNFSESRAHNYRSAFRYLESIADLPIRNIKAAQMQKCIDSCKTTQQREIKTVCRKTFEFALQQEYTDRNPSLYLKSNTIAPTIDREVFSPDQIADMWTQNDRSSKIALMLLYSGMRTKELLDLDPDDIDLEERIVHITKAKNASSIRIVPIHDSVLSLFRELKNEPYQITHDGLNKVLKTKYKRTAHTCRHTFTTRMKECGCDLLTLQLILGHTPSTITERVYTHISEKGLKDAISILSYGVEPEISVRVN